MNYDRCARTLIFFSLLVAVTFSTGCDSSSDSSDIDLDDPATLVGRYHLVSVVDKQGHLSGQEGAQFEAGEPRSFTEVEDGETFVLTITLDGTLELTSNRYTFLFTINVTTAQFPPFIDSEEDEGTWSVSGNTLTLDSDEDQEGPNDLQISADGDRITIEDESTRFVFEME